MRKVTLLFGVLALACTPTDDAKDGGETDTESDPPVSETDRPGHTDTDETDPPHTDETDPPHTDETDPPHTDETDPPHTDETDPPHTDETDPPHTDETDPPHTDETDVHTDETDDTDFVPPHTDETDVHTDETDDTDFVPPHTDETDETDVHTDETDDTDFVPPHTDETDETDVHTDETDDTDFVPPHTDETDETDTFPTDSDPVLPTDTHTDTDVDDTLVVDDLLPGDLRITEIHAVPGASCANDSEFFEILNATGATVDLQGLGMATTMGGNPVTVSYLLPAGERAVIARRALAFQDCYGFAPVHVLFVGMLDTGDLLRLSTPDGLVIDEVDFRTDLLPMAGTSWMRDDDDASAWCATAAAAPSGELASPGAANGTCLIDTDPPDETDTGHTDPVLPTDSGHEETDVEDLLGLADLTSSDLRITEFMANPAACGAGDPSEYIEVVYGGTEPVDLGGLGVYVPASGSYATLPGRVVVQPGERFVLARDAAVVQSCYGVPAVASYGFELSDTGVHIQLLDGGRVLTEHNAGTWPQENGAAWEFNELTGAGWCISRDRIGSTSDRGTPGEPNTACLPEHTDEPDDTDTDTDTHTDPVVVPGDLLITEVFDEPAELLKYVEVFNPGPDPMPLDGWAVGRWINDATTRDQVPLTDQPDVVLAPGDTWVIGRPATTSTYVSRFGGAPDHYDIRITGNGDDPYTLEYRGVLVDVYGEPGVDGTGTDWDYTDKVAWRVEGVVTPRTTWDASEWLISEDEADTSLGLRLPSDVRDTDVDSDPPVETDTESDPPVDTDPPPDSDTLPPALRIDQLGAGALTIVEFLATPDGCTEAGGEYIEIVYDGPELLDLFGLTIATTVRTTFVPGHAFVDPGRVVIGRDAAAFEACYGFAPDATANFDLDGTGGFIRLSDGLTRTFDTVATSTWDLLPGVAWQLDAAGDWCHAPAPSPSGDLGTPGDANPDCPVPVDTDTHTDTGHTDAAEPTDPPEDTDTEPAALPLALIDEDDLVITEFLADPTTCPDEQGEYIEVWYRGTAPVDLRGLEVRNQVRVHNVTHSVVVQPDTRFLLARDAAGLSSCLGVDALIEHGSGIPASGDVISLGDTGGRTFDTVDFLGWVIPAGVAMERDDVDPDRWCEAEDLIPGTLDRGTPGTTNGTCPVDTGDDPVAELALSDALPGDLVITEVMNVPRACLERHAEYIELHWRRPESVNLDGLVIQTNHYLQTLTGVTYVEGDSRIVIARTDGDLEACYGVAPDGTVQLEINNGGDRIRLYAVGLLDEYDFTGETGPEGVARERDDDDDDRWCFADTPLAGGDFGSPGQPNGPCPVDEHTDETDSPPLLTPDDLRRGDLLVVEWMPAPTACDDADGEYFEILYQGNEPADLQGLTFGYTNEPNFGVVDHPLVVQPGERFLVGAAGPNFSTCYGRAPDATVPWLMPDDMGGNLTLRSPSTLVLADEALYMLRIFPGRAWERDDDDGTWCRADLRMPNGDFGSPGEENGTCVFDSDTAPVPIDTDTDDSDTGPAFTADDLVPGDLVVTEVMIDPTHCADSAGQYIELLYQGPEEVDLLGLEIDVNGTTWTVPFELKVLPGEYVLAAPVATTCYGDRAIGLPGLAFPLAGPGTVQVGNISSTLDSTSWAAPPAAGVSLTRDLSRPTPTWCASTGLIAGTSDRGSPYAAGNTCP